MAAPTMTMGAAVVRASATLAANTSDTVTANLDFSAKIEGQVTVVNTPGGTVASTRGLRVRFYPRYGASPTTTTIPILDYTMPSETASTLESRTFYLGTGKWSLTLTNLDASNAITVAVSSDTVDGIA
jgi:hypothetical protein